MYEITLVLLWSCWTEQSCQVWKRPNVHSLPVYRPHFLLWHSMHHYWGEPAIFGQAARLHQIQHINQYGYIWIKRVLQTVYPEMLPQQDDSCFKQAHRWSRAHYTDQGEVFSLTFLKTTHKIVSISSSVLFGRSKRDFMKEMWSVPSEVYLWHVFLTEVFLILRMLSPVHHLKSSQKCSRNDRALHLDYVNNYAWSNSPFIVRCTVRKTRTGGVHSCTQNHW